MSSASGRCSDRARMATAPRSNVRSSFWSGGRPARAGSSRPDRMSRLRRRSSSAGVPVAVSTASGDPTIDRARRKGPRSSSSAATVIGVNPPAEASSPVARSSRVLPIPGSPSTVTAASRPPRATSISWRMAVSSSGRPTTAPMARRACSANGE